MPWVVFALIALFLAISITGHDLFSFGYFRSVFALLIVYLCWSAVINTSVSAYLRFAICLVQSPAFRSALLALNSFVRNYGMTVATIVAISWLLHRTLQVLKKPVPELIAILGVDVPEKPDLTLAGIRSDAATLTWAPPPPNRSVLCFVIEVNGVNVGEAPSQETAITVTGLKPSHFYNLRVIAVSSNNFRVGSRIIRIETHAADGRPNIDSRLVSDNYFATRRRPRHNTDSAHDNTESKVPSVETANLADTGLGPSGNQGAIGRRNTIGRKHSPSTASVEPPAPIKESKDEAEIDASVVELTTKLDQVRREIEEVSHAIFDEEEEHRKALTEFKAQKDEQQVLLKDRSDTSRKLKSDMAKSESAAQDAHKSVMNKKKAVEREGGDRNKMEERIKAMKGNMEEMQSERLRFEEERESLKLDHDKRANNLREVAESTRIENARLEKELKEKREKLRKLEAENKTLPSSKDDPAWKERRLQAKHENDRRTNSLSSQLGHLHRKTRELERTLMAMQSNPQHAIVSWNNQAKDRDFSQQNQIKRRGRATTSTQTVPIPVTSPTSMTSAEPAYPTTTPIRATAPPPGLTQFAEVPSYLNPVGQQRMDDEYGDGLLPAGEPPLSPGAAAYLPHGILGDEDQPMGMDDIIGARQPIDTVNVPQSPASSNRSLGHLPSPRGSANNLPYSSDVNERTSNLSLRSSPNPRPARASTTHGFSTIFSGWPKARGGKSVDEGGPPLGSLKSGQSRSLPRQTDDDALASRRRTGFTAPWNLFNRNSAGPDFLEGATTSSSRIELRGSFNHSSTGFAPPEADPTSPRPASMASSDLPRPSTDSGHAWPGMSFADFPAHTSHSRVWGQSRAQSRRTSIQAAPTTNLASEDDIILDKADLAKPEASPSQVGVIGSRPKKKSLNPTAASFMGSLMSRNKGDKEEAANGSDANAKAKVKKEKTKDKKDKKKSKDKEAPISTLDTTEFQLGLENSPTESRKFSTDGRTSVSISESHESFSLDAPHSNTPSEANAVSPAMAIKDQENVVKKIFRKGSAGKFNLSGKFSKDSGVGFFKKGPSSVATNGSERAERSSISISEADDVGEDGGTSNLAKSLESAASSPSLGPTSSVKGRWSMFRKKSKEKESLDLEREDTPTGES